MYGLLLLLIAITYLLLTFIPKKAGETQADPVAHKSFSIGLLSPLQGRQSEALERGLRQTLTRSPHATYTLTSYTGENDRIKIFNSALKALKKHDLIITQGVTTTRLAIKAGSLNNLSVPIIGTHIKKNDLSRLKDQVDITPYENLSAFLTKDNYPQIIDKLKVLKPTGKSLLLLYHRTEEASRISELVEYGAKHRIHVTCKRLPFQGDVTNQISSLTKSINPDTILLLRHTLAAAGIQELITFCNKEKITLAVRDLDGVLLGAAIGFGDEGEKIGQEVGGIMRRSLELKKPMGTEEQIEHIEYYYVAINQKTMAQQGLMLTSDQQYMLTHHKKEPVA